jgi:hypothetical protein
LITPTGRRRSLFTTRTRRRRSTRTDVANDYSPQDIIRLGGAAVLPLANRTRIETRGLGVRRGASDRATTHDQSISDCQRAGSDF